MFIGDHYWLADDGRLWGSKSQAHVTEADADYVAWKAAYNLDPSVWPADDAGNQTDATLQEVVGPLGMFVNNYYYSGNARWRRQETSITVASISPLPFLMDAYSRNMVANSQSLLLQAPAVLTLPWKMSDGSFLDLTREQMTTLYTAIVTYLEECFAVEQQVVVDLGAGTITTRAEIDAAFAAVSTDR